MIALDVCATPSFCFNVLCLFRSDSSSTNSGPEVSARRLFSGLYEGREGVDEGTRRATGTGVGVKLGKRGGQCGCPMGLGDSGAVRN